MEKSLIIKLLRDSIEGQDKNILNDPAYVFSDEDLESILKLVTPFHNPLYTIETIPDDEVYFVVLLAKKEVYYRLASSSAPFYPLEADGGGLKKNVRFDHYLELIKLVNDEYNLLYSEFKANKPIQVGDIYLNKKRYLSKLYNNVDAPTIYLTLDYKGDTFINVSWSKSSSQYFAYYDLYISETPIIDEYSDNIISEDAQLVKRFYDIHRTKYRISNLTQGKSYYVAIVVVDTFNLMGFSELRVDM